MSTGEQTIPLEEHNKLLKEAEAKAFSEGQRQEEVRQKYLPKCNKCLKKRKEASFSFTGEAARTIKEGEKFKITIAKDRIIAITKA